MNLAQKAFHVVDTFISLSQPVHFPPLDSSA